MKCTLFCRLQQHIRKDSAGMQHTYLIRFVSTQGRMFNLLSVCLHVSLSVCSHLSSSIFPCYFWVVQFNFHPIMVVWPNLNCMPITLWFSSSKGLRAGGSTSTAYKAYQILAADFNCINARWWVLDMTFLVHHGHRILLWFARVLLLHLARERCKLRWRERRMIRLVRRSSKLGCSVIIVNFYLIIAFYFFID